MDAAPLPPALAHLRERLGPVGWSEDPADLAAKLTDWRGRYHGHALALARPANTDDVAAVVRACRDAGVAITPQGGNTGLVGGATPQGELLLSLERLRAIRSVDAADSSLIAEAGVTLAAVQDAASAADRLFPLSLASDGAATVGGAAASNAGGVAVLRYGMMRDLVLGLEAVLPDGRVWDGLRTVRKDNLGYDLKHLLLGSEGTLAVITAVAVTLFPRPRAFGTAFCAVNGPADAVALLRRLQDALGDCLTAFELLPRFGVELVARHIPNTAPPLNGDAPWQVLVEASFHTAPDAEAAAFEATLADALKTGLSSDVALAQSHAQRAAFWRIRETLPEAERKHGKAFKHDVATPVSALPEFMARASEAVETILPGAAIIAFGHVGDGNLHFNVVPPPGVDPWGEASESVALSAADATPPVTRAIHNLASALGGSAAAEHGVGVLKKQELARHRAGVELDVMRAVKRALDPDGLMNPRMVL